MKKLHIFNCDTEYALAADSPNYTPPLKIRRVRQLFALTPSVYAKDGDALLLLDYEEDNLPKKITGNIDLFTLPEFARRRDISDYIPEPWGWNRRIVKELATLGFSADKLKSEEEIDFIRKLTHRSSTVTFHRLYGTGIPGPEYLTSEQEIRERISVIESSKSGSIYLKMPWSSSGHGVYRIDKDSDFKDVYQWVRGTLRRQGGVMIESDFKTSEDVEDMATEWYYDGTSGIADFLGFSKFVTNGKSHYGHNIRPPKYWKYSASLREAVEKQALVIQEMIGESYTGPLGIDMLHSGDRVVNPCLEINVRKTMGLVALEYFRRHPEAETFSPLSLSQE